jgi:cation:H+ antiporter
VTGHRIDRWEGALFFFYYAAYTGYVVLAALHHDALPAASVVMLEFVVPITIVTVVVLAVQGNGSSHGPDAARTR